MNQKQFFAFILASAALASAGVSKASVVVSMRDITGGIGVTCDTREAVSSFNCSAAAGFTVNSSDSVGFAGVLGGFRILASLGTSNAPGGTSLAEVNALATFIENLSGIAGQRLFFMDVQGMGFTLPTSPFKTVEGLASVSSPAFNGLDVVRSDFYASPLDEDSLLNNQHCTITVTSKGDCSTGDPLVWGPSGATFSLRDIQTFSLGNGSGVTASSTIVVRPYEVPVSVSEPISPCLLATALLALVGSSRRRIRSSR